ncbi:MAG: molecular chaperone TorD family protein [Halobacteria archaeon]|nr:molecular chaperone TorD family protein [Halobacteria archaeon]
MAADSALLGRQRAEAYWFLASLFGSPIGPDALERIASVNAGVPSEEQGIAAELNAALNGEVDWNALAQRLATEHARLFLGLREGFGPAPPYESLWRQGRAMGESTLAVARAYSEAGFDDKGPWGPCDHLVYELRFMASLSHAEEEASRAAAIEETEWARECQIRFLDEHLLTWVPEYCERIAEQAQEPLYQALAKVTGRVIAEDARQLRSDCTNHGADRSSSSGVGSAKRVET